jgi:hypothetical protein
MSTELVRQPEQQPNMLQVVMDAARNPETDPARLKEFLEIGRELQKDRARAEFNQAFAALKEDLPSIAKNGVVMNKAKTAVQFKFARYDDLHRTIKPILIKHGFATSFDFSEAGDGRMTCTLILKHSGGHEETRNWTLPAAGKNEFVSNLQNAAAARSFAKRCLLIDALDILTEDTDTDGVMVNTITDQQAQNIEVLLAECAPAVKPRLLTVYAVKSVGDIPANCYNGAVSLLEAARRAK